jgi:transcriptional regulator with XRE-family HTH domain
MIIQQVRLGQKLSQRDFAKKYGISQRWLSELELGTQKRTLTKLFKLFHLLDIDITADFEA